MQANLGVSCRAMVNDRNGTGRLRRSDSVLKAAGQNLHGLQYVLNEESSGLQDCFQ